MVHVQPVGEAVMFVMPPPSHLPPPTRQGGRRRSVPTHAALPLDGVTQQHTYLRGSALRNTLEERPQQRCRGGGKPRRHGACRVALQVGVHNAPRVAGNSRHVATCGRAAQEGIYYIYGLLWCGVQAGRD